MKKADEFFIRQYMAEFDDTEEDEAAVVYMETQKWIALTNIARDSKELETRRRVHRARADGHMRLWADYFAEQPTYGDDLFRRRFRMRRPLFNRIMEAVAARDDYFVQKADATGRLGLSTHQKVVASLRMLAYGASADIWGEYLCIGESTTLLAVKKFATAIVEVFGAEYTRSPTAADIARIEPQNAQRGFPGMLGSIDCMHWGWKNCPTAWHGQYTGHKQSPTIILEAVASYDTWIWRHFFGMPGSCNDLNVLHRSPVFQDLLHGRAPPFNYEVNGNSYNTPYYLADGIYPPYATLITSFKHPKTHKESIFSTAQESARKDVERAFGILQARFNFVRDPAMLWNKDALSVIMTACIIMHNMIVEDEQRDVTWRYENSQPAPEISRDAAAAFYAYMKRDTDMRDKAKHHQLRNDLMEHNWAIHAEHGL